MAAEEDDFYYPPERLAELLALAETAPYPISEDAKEAPPELVEAIRASALAYFAHLPISEQVEIFIVLSSEEQEDILADLLPEQRERLLIELSSETLKMS